MLAPSWSHPDTALVARQVLDRAGYAEPTITALLETSEMPSPRQRRRALPLYLCRSRGATPLETLVRLFLLNQPVPLDAARRALEPMPLADWAGAGLLVLGPTEARAAVELIAYQGLILAVDWADAGTAEPVMEVASTSQALAQLTVRRRVQRALDLGTGCGIQALLAARHSEHVSATELNPRAIELARFNTQLNGFSNVEFLQGDWFGPVEGRQFDLIVCNPPFVIAPGAGDLHTHSGCPSDALCREIIQTVPAFLGADAYFQLVGNWVQVTGQDWRERLAGWFEGSECDAWVLHAEPEAPATYALQRIGESEPRQDQAVRIFDEWMAYYEREGIEAIVSGLITLRRSARQPNRVCFDAYQGVSGEGGAAIERGFALRDFLEANCNDRDLLGARLWHAGHLCWEQRYEISEAGWSRVGSRLRLSDGLGFASNVDLPVAEFVARCRGDRTLGVALAELAEAAGQDAERLIPGFLRVVRRLVESGYLLPASMAHGQLDNITPNLRAAAHPHPHPPPSRGRE